MADSRTQRRATRARHDALVTLLHQGVDGVETLAHRVGVSPSTVRRDLTRLQAEGRIARTYGGAMVRDPFQERSFGESALLHQQAKAAIAGAAAGLVAPGATVFVDAGTTCLALARALVAKAPLTVVTRGLEAALLLAKAPDLEVVMVGGQIRPLSHGVVGPLSSIAFDRFTFDLAFLGADAVDPTRGVGEPTTEESFVKERAAARATAVFVLADSSKLDPANVAAWAPLPPSWSLVTDASVPAAVTAHFEDAGVHVLVAPPVGP
jgi:DeoR/GlpR family transcriptional regulator of sugar metabolism